MSYLSQTPRLGELLVARGALSGERLTLALADQCRGSERIGQTLIRLGMITRWQLYRALTEQYCLCLLTATGTMMMVFHPAAFARSSSASLQISVTVANTARVSMSPPNGAGSSPAAGEAALACREAAPMEVTFGSATLPAGGGQLTSQPVAHEHVECPPEGAPVAVALPASARKMAKATGLMNVEIDY